MKKIFTFMVALLMGMMFANAQVDSVVVNGNGTYAQYVDTVVTPVDSTMTVDTIGFIYDSTIVIDTTGDVFDTTYVVDTIPVFDTTYALYDTMTYNMIVAIPDSGWVFVSWVVTTFDSAECNDTLFVDVLYLDWWEDSIVCLTLTFDSIDPVGITDVNSNKVNVYPNPTSNYITVSCDNFKDVVIYNMNGAVMVTTTNKHIDMTEMPAGMYIMRVRTNDNKNMVTKIVKK